RFCSAILQKRKGGVVFFAFSFSNIRQILGGLLNVKLNPPREVPRRTGPAISSVRDDSRVRVRASRIPDEGIRLVQIDVVEQVNQFNPEFKFFALGKSELLEQRCVGPPIIRTPQIVSRQIAESPDCRLCKNSWIEETIPRAAGLRIAYDIGTIRTVI